MKNITIVTAVLSWFNLIIAGIFSLAGLFALLVSPAKIVALLSLLLTGAIVLHSYAALQLRRSVLDPAIPLDSKTPTGIRFIGFLALFFAIMNLSNAFMIIRNAKEMLENIQLPAIPEGVDMEKIMKGVGYFVLVFSLSVALNVLLNINLLQWYKRLGENRD